MNEFMTAPFWIPESLHKILIKQRQTVTYVYGDGVRGDAKEHVEQTYITVLDMLQSIFKKQVIR